MIAFIASSRIGPSMLSIGRWPICGKTSASRRRYATACVTGDQVCLRASYHWRASGTVWQSRTVCRTCSWSPPLPRARPSAAMATNLHHHMLGPNTQGDDHTGARCCGARRAWGAPVAATVRLSPQPRRCTPAHRFNIDSILNLCSIYGIRVARRRSICPMTP